MARPSRAVKGLERDGWASEEWRNFRPRTLAALDMAGDGGVGVLQGGEAPFAGKCPTWGPGVTAGTASRPWPNPCQVGGREPQKASTLALKTLVTPAPLETQACWK